MIRGSYSMFNTYVVTNSTDVSYISAKFKANLKCYLPIQVMLF